MRYDLLGLPVCIGRRQSVGSVLMVVAVER